MPFPTQCFLALGLLLAASDLPAAAAPPPNLVLILADDLGWSDLGCYGHAGHETPRIDQLAREGVRFTDAYAAPVCVPARAGILSGQSPARLHITAVFDRDGGTKPLLPPAWRNTLPLEIRTLPERLKELGYATGHVGKWHLGPPAEYWPEHHGFDVNVGGWREGDTKSFFPPYNNPRLPDGPPGEYLTDRLTDEAVHFIEDHREKPFFLYLAHLAPHTPLQAPKDEIARATGRPGVKHPVYAAMIHRLDTGVGRVLDTLDRLHLDQNTLVVFLSDNGGVTAHPSQPIPITTNAPLRSAKATLYEGGIRVPFIVRWPGVVVPGRTDSTPVIIEDILPTFVSAAGGRAGEPEIDGLDLGPLLRDGPQPERPYLAWHYPHYYNPPIATRPVSALRAGNLKLIENLEDGRLELYDLAADIGETNDLSSERPADAARLRDQLHAWRTRVGAQMPVPNPAYVQPKTVAP